MSEDRIKTEEGAALWRRFRETRGPVPGPESPDALLMAAYLDGALDEEEAARLEAQLAADPELLDEVLALRGTLDAAPEKAPNAVVARAQALSQPRPQLRQVAAETPSLLDRLFGAWLRPAVPAFATLAVMVACAGAFELGRYQSEQIESAEAAEVAASGVPVDLLLEGLL